MNTKKNTCVLFVGLICVLSVFAGNCAPAFASESIINEIDQSMAPKPVEDTKVQDTPVPVQPVKDSESVNEVNGTNSGINDTGNEPTPQNDVSTPDSEQDTDSIKQAETEEEDSREELKQDISAEVPEEVTDKKETVSEEVKYEKRSKTYHFSINRFLNRFSKLKYKICFGKKISIRKILHHMVTPVFLKNLDVRLGKTPACHQTADIPEVVPYYLIAPNITLDNKNFKNIIFPDKINSVTELMPYHLIVQNLPVKIEGPKKAVTHEGTTDTLLLMNAPSPRVSVKGKDTNAKIVIDIHNNTLYKYDKMGFPQKAYPVATGARGMRTMPGLRIVTHKENFPYLGAPDSKRGRDPYSYGPHIIFLNIVDPDTGRQCCVEQLLHGNGNEASIGRKVSHGCVRTNNKVMHNELAKEVTRGDYVLLINPDPD